MTAPQDSLIPKAYLALTGEDHQWLALPFCLPGVEETETLNRSSPDGSFAALETRADATRIDLIPLAFQSPMFCQGLLGAEEWLLSPFNQPSVVSLPDFMLAPTSSSAKWHLAHRALALVVAEYLAMTTTAGVQTYLFAGPSDGRLYYLNEPVYDWLYQQENGRQFSENVPLVRVLGWFHPEETPAAISLEWHIGGKKQVLRGEFQVVLRDFRTELLRQTPVEEVTPPGWYHLPADPLSYAARLKMQQILVAGGEQFAGLRLPSVAASLFLEACLREAERTSAEGDTLQAAAVANLVDGANSITRDQFDRTVARINRHQNRSSPMHWLTPVLLDGFERVAKDPDIIERLRKSARLVPDDFFPGHKELYDEWLGSIEFV